MKFVDKFATIVMVLLITITNCADIQDDTLELNTNVLLQQFQSTPMDIVLTWNLVALQTVANDFDPKIISILDQPGAGRVSRALAIIHAAMYDAMTAFNVQYKPIFTVGGLPNTSEFSKEVPMTVAIMQAAYETLYALYPKQRSMFDVIRAYNLRKTQENNPLSEAINMGIQIGQKIASTILEQRENDGSRANVTYTPNLLPGYHRVDPTRPTQGYDTPQWGSVTPFIIDSILPFRAPNFVGDSPSMRLNFINSPEYIAAYEEVKSIGERFSTSRTDDQTEIGKFWGYDGAQKLGPTPRMHNQVVRVVAIKMKNTLVDNARLFAMVNFALADTRISIWNSKYYYALWRPIIAIHDGTSSISPDPTWLPLGAGANGNGDNFTPNHPSYPSGHVSAASSVFEILRLFYGTDKISFEYQSDEFNGRTNDSITKMVRPAKTRQYRSFSEAEHENFLARIFLGIHWRFDDREALNVAHKIAKFIHEKLA